jgi:enoyl-CoA hydratase/carnithine racemase
VTKAYDEGIDVTRVSPGVARITLDRPASHNALTPSMLGILHETVGGAEAGDLRALVVVGRGPSFCSGYDTRGLADGAGSARSVLESALRAVEETPVPVIAAVRGHCIGAGLDLALACDLRLASPTARFAMPPAKLGVVYPPAGLRRLVQAVGPSWARYLLYSAEPVDHQTAATIGLVQRSVGDEALDDEAMTLAQTIAGQRAPLSVRGAKRIIRAILDADPGEDLDRSPELDRLIDEALGSHDLKEALEARAERRPPRFTGS